jgi:hypothetical protein
MVMYSEEYEFTAVHETGHAICVESFPRNPGVSPSFPPILSEDHVASRIKIIIFGYDKTENRFDGLSAYTVAGLSDEQLLFHTLGGRVAELMARTEGNWNVTDIQKKHLSGEFDDTRDIEIIKKLLANICPDNKNGKQEYILTQMIFSVFSFLKAHWDIVNQVTSDILEKYNQQTQEATVSYGTLSPNTRDLLRQIAYPTFPESYIEKLDVCSL